MTARMRRLVSDWEQVKKDFTGHSNILVTPIGNDIPEKYHVTYFVNGVYLLPDGRIQTLARHEVEITLHAEYPRYKPVCTILTPIWHPNFKDGQICIGDIWGAGESLSDIIINIGDMIQYKSWNSFSPLSAEAAKWAIENKHLFPVGNIDLYVADYGSAKEVVEIDLFDEDFSEKEPTQAAPEEPVQKNGVFSRGEKLDDTYIGEGAQQMPFGQPSYQNDGFSQNAPAFSQPVIQDNSDMNDFEITADELAGIEFVPTAQRMQTLSTAGGGGRKINFKTIVVKGILWALIGSFLGFFCSEFFQNGSDDMIIASVMGHSELADYFKYTAESDEAWDEFYTIYEDYCKDEGLDPDDMDNFEEYIYYGMSDKAEAYLDEYYDYDGKAEDALWEAYTEDFNENEDDLFDCLDTIQRGGTALWSAVIALFIGLFLGFGEGIFYGSKENAVKYGAIGAVVSLVMGAVSGYIAQTMYSELLEDDASDFTAALIRGFAWAIMGLGIGLATGLIKPEKKRILLCTLGGIAGGFLGGFIFNFIFELIPEDVVARGVGIVVMGLLIGIGVGVLEQFAKQAWLKVIRGEFEGKEYLVFSGTTSIGNNGKNTIVLFKDKLVGPHHCDIRQEGGKYVLLDCGTPMGTVVNGNKIARQILRHGDVIAIGNSVLVFNTK